MFAAVSTTGLDDVAVKASAPDRVTSDPDSPLSERAVRDVLVAPADASTSPVSPYQIELGFFSGPLDLLLHLVRQQEVPLNEVRMSLIAEQYLSIVSEIGDYDLDRASEFLVVAATLLDLKSRSYLPGEATAEGEDVVEAAPDAGAFEELRRRLQTYEETKLRAERLMELPQLDVDTFVHRDSELFRDSVDLSSEPEEASRLGQLFVKLLEKVQASMRTIRIQLEPVSVVSMMMKVVDIVRLPSTGTRRFTEVLREILGLHSGHQRKPLSPEAARTAVIGGFIAVLELVKRGVVRATHDDQTGQFQLEMRLSADEVIEPLASEFDSAFEDAKTISVKQRTPEVRHGANEAAVLTSEERVANRG